MNDWKTVTLADLGPITTGKTPPSGTDTYFGGQIPFVTPSDMSGQRYINVTGRSLTNEGLRTVSRRTLSSGSILVSCIGSDMGKTHIARHDFYTNQQINTIEVVSPNANPLFVYYNLSARKEELQRLASGSSAQPILNKSNFSRIAIALPSLGDQYAITNLLGSLDDKIELNRRMNETLEAMAQAIFRDWFVDFGPTRRKLEGATDPIAIMGGLVQGAQRAQVLSDLFPAALGDDEIPVGWRLRRVGDVAARIAMGPFGSRITKDNFVERGVPVIRGKNLSSGFVDSNFVFLTPEKATELNGSVARQEDIVFTHRGTLGQVGRIYPGSAFDEYVVSQSQLLLSVDRQQTSSLFLYYFFISEAGQRAWLANAGGAGVPAIASPTRSLKGIQFVDPGVSIAIEFDRLTSCLEKRIVAAKYESSTLAATRDLLIPKLMSGEIRLDIANAD